MILGLDLGKSTGWCKLWPGSPDRFEYGTFVCEGDNPRDRCVSLHDWLSDEFRPYEYELTLSVEEAFQHSRASSRAYWMYFSAVCIALPQSKIHTVHSGKLKKWATGDGKAPKESMVAAAAVKLGKDGLGGALQMTHDEADAILLAAYAKEHFL